MHCSYFFGSNLSIGRHFIGGGIMMVLFWIAIILLGVALYNAFKKKSGDKISTETESTSEALRILQLRYANSEIDEKEYLQKKGQLNSK